jgi:hypothetical protein
MESRSIYQRLYQDSAYGDHDKGRCPGLRLFPKYIDHIIQPVIDLGCGRGGVVLALREIGVKANGMDFIDIGNGMMVGDITGNLSEMCAEYATAICIDVFEHIDDFGVLSLISNMSQCARQVISIHNGPSVEGGVDLHVNKKPFETWESMMETGFKIKAKHRIHKKQMLYLCEAL